MPLLARLAAWTLAASGTAWLAAAASLGAVQEMLYCGSIFAGYLLAAAALQWGWRRPVQATGWLAAAAGNAAPLLVYGVDASLLTWGVAAAAAGLAAVALGVLGGERGVWPVRGGAALAGLGALVPVLQNDLSGPSIWTAGNVLALVGAALLAATWRDEP